MTTKNKTGSREPFDCLEYKATVQAEIQAELAGKSHAEQLPLLKQRAEEGPLGEWWKRIGTRAVAARPQDAPHQLPHF